MQPILDWDLWQFPFLLQALKCWDSKYEALHAVCSFPLLQNCFLWHIKFALLFTNWRTSVLLWIPGFDKWIFYKQCVRFYVKILCIFIHSFIHLLLIVFSHSTLPSLLPLPPPPTIPSPYPTLSPTPHLALSRKGKALHGEPTKADTSLRGWFKSPSPYLGWAFHFTEEKAKVLKDYSAAVAVNFFFLHDIVFVDTWLICFLFS